MKKSRIARPIAAVESPTVRSLPLVELLVDTSDNARQNVERCRHCLQRIRVEPRRRHRVCSDYPENGWNIRGSPFTDAEVVPEAPYNRQRSQSRAST